MIDEYAQEAFESEGFTQLTRNSLQMVLRRDTLEADEMNIYNACIRWAEAECHRLHLEVDTFLVYDRFTRTKEVFDNHYENFKDFQKISNRVSLK